MAYQKTVDLIRTIAESINSSGTFEHCRKWDASLASINAPLPLIVLYPISSQDDFTTAEVSTSTILIGFWLQDAPNSSNEEREKLLADAEVLYKKFIRQVVESDEFDVVGTVKNESNYRQFAGTLSGWLASFQLKTSESPC